MYSQKAEHPSFDWLLRLSYTEYFPQICRLWMAQVHCRISQTYHEDILKSHFLQNAYNVWGCIQKKDEAIWGSIKLVGVPQCKAMHRFSPNYQSMFIPRGTRAD